jgi:hypothetical protein
MNWPPTGAGTEGAAPGPAGHWPRLAGLAAMLAAAAVALAACGGDGSAAPTPTTGSSNFGKALAFSKCMRSHGVPDFPDPNSSGVFVQQNGGPSQSESQPVLRAAQQACQHLMPSGGGPGSLTQGQKQQMERQALKFVRCMRAHGLPNMPDPKADGQITLPPDMNGNSPQVKTAQQACQSLQPGPPGGGQ